MLGQDRPAIKSIERDGTCYDDEKVTAADGGVAAAEDTSIHVAAVTTAAVLMNPNRIHAQEKGPDDVRLTPGGHLMHSFYGV